MLLCVLHTAAEYPMGRLCFGEYDLDYFNWPLYLAELNIFGFR